MVGREIECFLYGGYPLETSDRKPYMHSIYSFAHLESRKIGMFYFHNLNRNIIQNFYFSVIFYLGILNYPENISTIKDKNFKFIEYVVNENVWGLK